MNIRAIVFYIGYILRLEALMLLPSIGIALYRHEMSCVVAFLIAFAVLMIVGQGMVMLKPNDRSIRAKEGFVIVALGWIFMSVFGCLPFILSGYIPNFVDALFETTSGFTTTGATILTDVEVLPRSLLYWRSFTHWVGGMGVLVFMLAIVPSSKGSGDSLHILHAESPGPVVGKLVPKMRFTARILYAIYIALTVIEIILLVAGGMPFFDSLIHAFGTAGTGGFSNMNLSVAAYNNVYFEIVIGVFMALFGVNFTVYHCALVGDFKSVFRNEELRLYFLILVCAILAITINILPLYGNSFFTSLRYSFFQVSSIMTTTDFSTADFSEWPEFSRLLLIALMIIGACAGSTGGGIKVSRLLILGKSAMHTLRKLSHPQSVSVLRIDGRKIGDNVLSSVNGFLVIYLGICAASIVIVSLDNLDTATTISAVFACLNNIGPGLNVVGPLGNYNVFSGLSKVVLIFDMLLGRLEIFPIVMLFSPMTWRRL